MINYYEMILITSHHAGEMIMMLTTNDDKDDSGDDDRLSWRYIYSGDQIGWLSILMFSDD